MLTIRPVPPVGQAPTDPSDQQGATLPFCEQAGTFVSTEAPKSFGVWLTTVQSKSPVAGSVATNC